MKVVIYLDEDGHFNATDLSNREKVFEFITKLEYGNLWDYRDVDEFPDDFNYISLSDVKWIEFVSSFSSQGGMEIVDLFENSSYISLN